MRRGLAWIRGGLGGAAIVACIFLGGAVSVADAQSSDPPQNLRETVNRYVAAWNTHDPGTLASFFTADADMIMGNGPLLRGRPAVEQWWREYFAVQEPERTLTIDVLSTRAITVDVAMLNVRTTTGGRTTQGTDLIARRARGTWLLVRQGGDWLVAAMRGMPTEQDRIVRSHEQPNR